MLLFTELPSTPNLLASSGIRTGLGAMIEEECEGLCGDPEREARAWLEKLAEADRRRDGYIDLAAEGILERDELRARLAQGSRDPRDGPAGARGPRRAQERRSK